MNIDILYALIKVTLHTFDYFKIIHGNYKISNFGILEPLALKITNSFDEYKNHFMVNIY